MEGDATGPHIAATNDWHRLADFDMADSYDLYFSADVETDGPIPGKYSMLAFGLAVAGRFDGQRFERIDPIPASFSYTTTTGGSATTHLYWA